MSKNAYPMDVTQVLDVRVPVSLAYQQWQHVEQWPQFTESFGDLRPLGEGRFHAWGDRGGQGMDWEMQLVEQVPDRLIRWASTSDDTWMGSVAFEPLSPSITRVTLHIRDTLPHPQMEPTLRTLRMNQRLAADLYQFKQWVEARHLAEEA